MGGSGVLGGPHPHGEHSRCRTGGLCLAGNLGGRCSLRAWHALQMWTLPTSIKPSVGSKFCFVLKWLLRKTAKYSAVSGETRNTGLLFLVLSLRKITPLKRVKKSLQNSSQQSVPLF